MTFIAHLVVLQITTLDPGYLNTFVQESSKTHARY